MVISISCDSADCKIHTDECFDRKHDSQKTFLSSFFHVHAEQCHIDVDEFGTRVY